MMAAYDKKIGYFYYDDSYWQKWHKIYNSNPQKFYYAYIIEKESSKKISEVNFHPLNIANDCRNIEI